jgi:aminomethyltransferase
MNLDKKIFLHDQHLKLGAKMVPFAGYLMPIQYHSVKDEALSVRNHVGIFDVSHMGEFWVEGKDASVFVDYLITNEFSNVPKNKAVYSPLCNEQGKIIDDLIAYKIDHHRVLICVNAANLEKDFAWIISKKSGFDVTITNKSNETSLVAIQGPKSASILAALGINDVEDLSYYSVLEFKNLIIARTGYTGEDGFEIFGPHESIAVIWHKALELGVVPCGLAARDVLRLEVCFPLYGNELSEQLTPLDSGLKWAVNFNKNNFIGKEALSEYSPQFSLIKLLVEGAIPRKDFELFQNNQVIGKITSGTMSVVLNKGIALALIQKELFSNNQKLIINVRGKQLPVEIIKAPFVKGGHK